MGKHINYDQKTNILILQTQKKGPSAIAKELKLPKSTIFNFLKRYQKRGTVYNNYHGGNKPKSIDERTERRLVRNAISNRRKTTRQLKDMLDLECDIRTIRNTLKRNQIRPRRPRKKPSLDKNQMQKRYAGALTHQYGTIDQGRRILWSDEKKINLFYADGNEKVGRKENEELKSDCVTKMKKFGRGSIMIGGAIAGNGLRIINQIEGMLTAEKYTHILEESVRESFNQFGEYLNYYQEDNDPKHGGPKGAILTREWFENNPDIIRMDGPANSPDLNPIENVWHMLQMRICQEKNRTMHNLFEISEKNWNCISTEEIRAQIDSLPNRIQAVLKAKGGYTKY